MCDERKTPEPGSLSDNPSRLAQIPSVVRQLVREMRGVTYEDKLAIIRSRPFAADYLIMYERRTAALLEELKEQQEIADWYPTQANGFLDKTCIDFLVRRKPEEIVFLQCASSKGYAQAHRHKIRALFGEDSAVAMIHFLSRKKHTIPYREVRQRLTGSINSRLLMRVEVGIE